MKLKLHEIELNAKDVEASGVFYHDLLGLAVAVDQEGLKVFDTGWPGVDLNASTHKPGKLTISFLVEDIEECIAELTEKGCRNLRIYETHLGMQAIELKDPDGNRIEIQSPTDKSPQFLHDMLE